MDDYINRNKDKQKLGCLYTLPYYAIKSVFKFFEYPIILGVRYIKEQKDKKNKSPNGSKIRKTGMKNLDDELVDKMWNESERPTTDVYKIKRDSHNN